MGIWFKVLFLGCSMKNRTIFEAARYGDYKCLMNHLKYSINVDEVDKDGITPLVYAVKYGRVNCCKLLLGGGARVDVVVDGMTLVDEAVKNRHWNKVKLLFQHGARMGDVGREWYVLDQEEWKTFLKIWTNLTVEEFVKVEKLNKTLNYPLNSFRMERKWDELMRGYYMKYYKLFDGMIKRTGDIRVGRKVIRVQKGAIVEDHVQILNYRMKGLSCYNGYRGLLCNEMLSYSKDYDLGMIKTHLCLDHGEYMMDWLCNVARALIVTGEGNRWLPQHLRKLIVSFI